MYGYKTYEDAEQFLIRTFGADLAEWGWNTAWAKIQLEVVGRQSRLNRDQRHRLGAATTFIDDLFTELRTEHTARLAAEKSYADVTSGDMFTRLVEERDARLAAEKRYEDLVASIQGLVETHIKPLLEDTGETAEAS